MSIFIKSPILHFEELQNKVSQMNSSNYIYNLENPDCIKPVEQWFHQWFERVNHYLYLATYKLVDSENYKDCKDFIILDKFRITNLDDDLLPKCYVLKDAQWIETPSSSNEWKIDWLFSNLDFWRVKDKKVSSKIEAENLIYKMAFEDVFGVDHSDLILCLYSCDEDEEKLDISNSYLSLFSIFEHLVKTPYSQKIDEEPYFDTKKESKAWLKSMRNPYYINKYRRFDTERKINQIIIKLINRDFFEFIKGAENSFSFRVCNKYQQKLTDCMPRLVQWKQENKNKFLFFSLIIEHKNFYEYVSEDDFFGNDNRLQLLLLNNRYDLESLGTFSLTRKSLNLLFNLPKSIFVQIIKLLLHQNPQKGVIVLNWLGSSFMQKRIHVWVTLAVIQNLWMSNNKIIGFENQKELNKLYKALSLSYECCMQLWKEKKKVSPFFTELSQTHVLADYTHYLFCYQIIDEMLVFNNLSHVSLNSNLQSIKRKSEDWHKVKVLKDVEEVTYAYPQINETINGFEFQTIKTTCEAALESYDMKHCLFNNYSGLMLRGEYVAFRVIGKEIRGTFGAFAKASEENEKFFELEYNQCFSVGNKKMPSLAHSACKKLVKLLNKQNPTCL